MDSIRHQDHYEVLGVAADADAAEIRRAFRARVKEIHPDVAADKSGANEAFLELKEAYNVLSDPERRARYDSSLASRRPRAGPSASGRRPNTSAPEPPFGWREPSGPTHPPPDGDTWTRHQRTLTIEDLLQRAMREIGAGRNAHARRDLVEVLAREPENPDALVLMGRLYHAEGKMQDWIRILEEGVRKNPGHVAMRLALNEARRSLAEGLADRAAREGDEESRRRAYLATGLIVGALSVAWGVLHDGRPFVLRDFVPVSASLVTGMMLCALVAGWTMAATGFLAPLDDELFFPDTHSHTPGRRRSRAAAPPGLAVPFLALLHIGLALMAMATLVVTRGVVSRSLAIVTGFALLLAILMAMAAPSVAGSIIWWCSGWLLFALFAGWLVGDMFR